VIELDERLQRHAEPAAIVQDGVVVVGNSPRPRIEVEAFVEGAVLRGAAEFRIDVAAPDRPVPAARSRVVFEHLDLVSRAAEFIRRRHSGETRSENDD
jgi:hypothetical protein